MTQFLWLMNVQAKTIGQSLKKCIDCTHLKVFPFQKMIIDKKNFTCHIFAAECGWDGHCGVMGSMSPDWWQEG